MNANNRYHEIALIIFKNMTIKIKKFIIYTILLYMFYFFIEICIGGGKVPHPDFINKIPILFFFLLASFMSFKFGVVFFELSNDAPNILFKIMLCIFYITIYFLIGLFLFFLAPGVYQFVGFIYVIAAIEEFECLKPEDILCLVIILSNYMLILAGFVYKFYADRKSKIKN